MVEQNPQDLSESDFTGRGILTSWALLYDHSIEAAYFWRSADWRPKPAAGGGQWPLRGGQDESTCGAARPTTCMTKL